MDIRNAFDQVGGYTLAGPMSGKSPLGALAGMINVPLSLGVVEKLFESNLAEIVAEGVTGLDQEGRRVPLFFIPGVALREFSIGTEPRLDARGPQKRNDYRLEILGGDNLIVHRTRIEGESVVGEAVLGQAKFADARQEIADAFAAVLLDIRDTFCLENAPAPAASIPARDFH